MRKFIKNYWKTIVFILVFPFILDWVLRFIWWIPIPIKESAPLSEWLGFLGAYFGVIGAIAVVWWQHIENKKQLKKQEIEQREILSEQKLQFEKQLKQNEELTKKQIENEREIFEKQLKEDNEREIKGLLRYVNYYIEKSLKEFTIETMENLKYKGISFLYFPNKAGFVSVPLKNLNLSKEEIVTFFKYNFNEIIELKEKIENFLEIWCLSREEEDVLDNIVSALKPSYDNSLNFLKKNLSIDIRKEDILTLINNIKNPEKYNYNKLKDIYRNHDMLYLLNFIEDLISLIQEVSNYLYDNKYNTDVIISKFSKFKNNHNSHLKDYCKKEKDYEKFMKNFDNPYNNQEQAVYSLFLLCSLLKDLILPLSATKNLALTFSKVWTKKINIFQNNDVNSIIALMNKIKKEIETSSFFKE